MPTPDQNLDMIGSDQAGRHGMGSHQGARMLNDEWLTPPDLLAQLGAFDLDPCAPVSRPWDTATKHYTVQENGLVQPWEGRVFLNPPYGRYIDRWLARMADHGNGIGLIFARTETRAWQEFVWPRVDAMLFMAGRLHFHYQDGRRAAANSGAPTVLLAYGAANVDIVRAAGIPGAFVSLK